MYIRFLTRRVKKLQKHLEKVEIWNPSVFCLLSSDQIIKENLHCGAIAENHKNFNRFQKTLPLIAIKKINCRPIAHCKMEA
jgi:hypothetical protein